MNTIRDPRQTRLPPLLWAAAALLAACAAPAQVPVDEDGNLVALGQAAEDAASTPDEQPSGFAPAELETLVGPIALYPDDLLAIVLPASTYPLEIVQAARFLERLKADSSLEPDESWDDSVIALLNYPEVVEMMSEDLEWTGRLGDAVLVQQADVIAAIERFRDRAYASGNLQSDGYQKVERNDDGAIEIRPVAEDVIYVPYYEPERVIVHQPRPVYHYYPQAYPVYYYPYPAHYRFPSGYFWGVTTAFRVGWSSHHLHVFHHTYWGHPYYGRSYFGHYYRYPSISVFNTYYVNHDLRRPRHHHRDGVYWRPRIDAGARPGLHRSRTAYFRERRRERTTDGYRNPPRYDSRQIERRPGLRGGNAPNASTEGATPRRGFASSRDAGRQQQVRERRADEPIRFRPRAGTGTVRDRTATADEARRAAAAARRQARESTTNAPAARPPVRNRSSSLPRRDPNPLGTARGESRSTTAPAARRGFSSTAPRSTPAPRATAPRRADPPARSAAPRAGTPRRAASGTSRSTAPRASAPRTSTPRAAPAARPAPAPRNSAAPARRSGGLGAGNRARSQRQ